MLPPSPPRRRPGAAAFLPALAASAALAVFAAHQRDPQAAAETAFLALLATALLAAVAALEAAPGAPAAARPTGGGAVGAATAVLVVLAAWMLPAGPLRGAAVAALLVGALAVVAGRRLSASPGGTGAAGTGVGAGTAAPATGAGSEAAVWGAESHGAPAAPPAARGTAAASEGPLQQVLSTLPLVVPLALAVQVLVRSDRLLAPELGPRLLGGLLGLPLVAAVAIALLMARAGRAPALAAAATAALLGPGFTTLTAGALVAIAAAEAAWRPRGQGPGARYERVIGALAVAAAVVGVGLIAPWAAVVIALAALLLGGHGVVVGAVALAAAVAAIAVPGAGGWSGELALAATTVSPLAVVVALAAASRGARWWALAAGVAALLAFVAARTGGGFPLLAAPLAAVPLLAGRSLAARAPGERHALFAPQVVWSAALLAATVLAAAYPWLRPRPLPAALALFAFDGGWAAATVVAAVGAAAAVLGGRAMGALPGRGGRGVPAAAVVSAPDFRSSSADATHDDHIVGTERAAALRGDGASVGVARLAGAGGGEGAAGHSRTVGAGSSASPSRFGVGGARGRAHGPGHAASPPLAAALAAAALFVALVAALPSPRSQVLIADPRSLDAESPRLEIELPRWLAGGELVVVADTSLSHAVAVPAATPVASMFLIGEPVAGVAAPPSSADGAWTLVAGRDSAEWSSRRPDVAALAAHPVPEPWLARVAADGFFGLAFRSRGVLQAPGGNRRLVVERHPGLPPETVVHLHRIEVRR